MDFQARERLLGEFGIQYTTQHEYRGKTPERRPVDLQLFKSVVLPLTAEDWLNLCQQGGDHYVGGCCGCMSHLQDIMNGIFREEGIFSCGDLEQIALTVESHGDEPCGGVSFLGTLEDALEIARKDPSALDPWDKIALAWHIVQGHYTPEVPKALRKDIPPVEAALHVLRHSIHYLSMTHLTRHVFENTDQLPKSEIQSQATSTVQIAKSLPALRTLLDRLSELGMPPTDGFAIIDTEAGPDAVASNGFGYCFFQTRQEIEALVRSWRETEAQYKEETRHSQYRDLAIRRARVSIENGLEFLDDGPEPLPQ